MGRINVDKDFGLGSKTGNWDDELKTKVLEDALGLLSSFFTF